MPRKPEKKKKSLRTQKQPRLWQRRYESLSGGVQTFFISQTQKQTALKREVLILLLDVHIFNINDEANIKHQLHPNIFSLPFTFNDRKHDGVNKTVDTSPLMNTFFTIWTTLLLLISPQDTVVSLLGDNDGMKMGQRAGERGEGTWQQPEAPGCAWGSPSLKSTCSAEVSEASQGPPLCLHQTTAWRPLEWIISA